MLDKIKNVLYITFLIIIIWQLTMSKNSLMNQEASFEIDGNTYVISNMGKSMKSDPDNIKSVGTRIVCDTLKDITGVNVAQDQDINGTKSFLSGNKLKVSCVEPFSGIAIDYMPKESFEYGRGSKHSKDVYEFYDRLALNQYKKEILNNGGLKYFTVPYTVDHCEKINGEYKCEDSPNITDRKRRIREYLSETISDIL